MTSTPVLMFVFNRPDLARRTAEAIRDAHPPLVLIVADGPRPDRPNDIGLCRETRQAVDEIDWPCEVLRNYAGNNLGCGVRVSSGISWAFEHVESAIILEDDCVPSPSFFGFCDQLLARYRDNDEIMHIGGTNMVPGHLCGRASYRFSKYPHIWGWATWKRAWERYDFRMSAWDEYRLTSAFSKRCSHPLERAYWTWYYDRMTGDDPFDTWDYQWTFACWLNNGLAVSPSVNLVTNVGYRADGTHTTEDSPWANMPTFDIGEIVHPPRIEADRRADWWEFVHHYGGEWYREQTVPLRRVRMFASRVRAGLKRRLCP